MKIEVVRVTRHIFRRQGDSYLPVGVILKIARKIAQDGGQQAKDEPDELEDEETPEGVPEPSEWGFDDERQTVSFGDVSLRFQSGTQYRLLKYAASGGTDLQEAWRVAWEYDGPAEWRTVKKNALRINQRLSAVGLVPTFSVSTKKIMLHVPKKTG